jgi:hypothetical protein
MTPKPDAQGVKVDPKKTDDKPKTQAEQIAEVAAAAQRDQDERAAKANRYKDGRISVESREYWQAQTALQELMTSDWLAANTEVYGMGSDKRIKSQAVKDLVDLALRTINGRRLGDPAGTIARSKDGAVAHRYYSDQLGKLVWLILAAPSDQGVDVTDTDELGEGWTTVYRPDWPIHQ